MPSIKWTVASSRGSIDSVATTERPLPKEQWPLLRQIAMELEKVSQYDQAEKLIKEDVGYEPQQDRFGGFLRPSRQGRCLRSNLLDQNRKKYVAGHAP